MERKSQGCVHVDLPSASHRALRYKPNLSPHSSLLHLHAAAPTLMFPDRFSALRASTTPSPHSPALHIPCYPASLSAPTEKVLPMTATTLYLLPGKESIRVLELNPLHLPSPAHHRQAMEAENRTLPSSQPSHQKAVGLE